jgi:uncharacterized protein (TIGR02246 family)
MNMRLCVLGSLGLVLSLLSHDFSIAQETGTTPADQKALAVLVHELDSAYNVRDAARFSALFAEDADFEFVVEGLTMRGRDQIRQHFAKQFSTRPLMRHVTTTGTTDAITPGILAVDMQVDILAVDPKANSSQTLLVHYSGVGLGIRTDSGWRIRLVRLYRMPGE